MSVIGGMEKSGSCGEHYRAVFAAVLHAEWERVFTSVWSWE